MEMINVDQYRVLIVDDEPDMCKAAKKQIAAITDTGKIHVDEAYTGRVAINKVRSRYYDLILLDLYKGRVLAGYEVYRKLNEIGCSSEIMFMTRFRLDPSVDSLLKALASGGSTRLVGFIDKRAEENESIQTEVEKRYEKFVAAELSVANLGLASRLIDRRRGRYSRPGLFPLRESLSEVDAEVERLLRQLYVELPPSLLRSTEVAVSLEPMDRRGLSAAVVVNATVELGIAGATESKGGHKTVLKIGPRPDILEEASRFREFVRYGVELDQRIELLAVATADSLGALVYSFAGGVYRRILSSLDDVMISDLRANSLQLSREVLQGLFQSRHWYEVRTRDVPVSRYFSSNYRNDLLKSADDGEEALFGLGAENQLGPRCRVERARAYGKDGAHFTVTVGQADPLIIPDSSVLGMGAMYGSTPACLVHGDMHAGNVMLEMSEMTQEGYANRTPPKLDLRRVCLIDFRNAGPGPRTIDAVALESSVRLADAEAVCRTINVAGESDLSEEERFEVAEKIAGRVTDELALYRAVFRGGEVHSTEGWQGLAAEILIGVRSCFPNVELREYLGTSIRYTIRQLGFDMEPVARVRLLSWLAAQYDLLRNP